MAFLFLGLVMIDIKYKPHQGYCMRCTHLTRHCDLDFKSMKKHDSYGDYVVLVRCTEFIKKER